MTKKPLAELRLRHPLFAAMAPPPWPAWLSGLVLEAAVAVVLRGRNAGEAEVLLVRRAARAGDPWSGDMALPGGRRQADDADLRATAMRETAEEVGLVLASAATCIGRLPRVVTLAPSGNIPLRPMLVSPWVFVWAGDAAPELMPSAEVAAARWVRLATLRDPAVATTRPWRRLGVTWPAPAWRVGEDIVWGLTRQMLRTLFRALDDSDAADEAGGD